MPQESNPYLRELGRPQVEAQDNGLHKITRRYVASGASTDSLLADFWGGSPGGPTLDKSYTDACLIQQYFEASEDNTTQVLVRVFQELDPSGTPTELGRPDYKRDADDLLEITRKYIALRTSDPDYNKPGRVGNDLFEGCLLGKVVADKGTVFEQIVETYFEKGIISTKYEEKHNGKLKQYSIRSIGLETKAEVIEKTGLDELVDFVLITSMVGSGSTDYEFGGLEVRTWVFVKGEGLVSHEFEEKGTAEITTDKVFIPKNSNASWEEYSDIPLNEVYETKAEEADGYIIYTILGVVGEGELERRTEYRHNGALTLITIRNLGAQSEVPAGFVRIKEELDESGNFDIYTDVYAQGNGVISEEEQKIGDTVITTTVRLSENEEDGTISGNVLKKKVDSESGYWKITEVTREEGGGVVDRTEETKYNGALTIIKVTQLGTSFTATENGAVISSRDHTYQDMPAVTRVFARGVGIISEEEKQVGETSITETVRLAEASESTEIAGNVIAKKVESRDGYYVITETTRDEMGGVVDRREETKHQGALTVTTITQLGASFTAIPNEGTLISERDHTYQESPAITRVYAHGTGVITEEEKKIGETTVTETVRLSPTTENTDISGNTIAKRVDARDGYYLIRETTRDEGGGIVDSREETKYNGALIIRTVTQLGSTFDAVVDGVMVSTREHTYQDFPAITRVFATGVGVISEEEEKIGETTVTRTVRLSETAEEPTISGDVIAKKVESKDGYYLITESTRDEQGGVVERKEDIKHNGALTVITVTQLGSTFTANETGAVISTRDHTYREFPAITKVFATGNGVISTEDKKIGDTTVVTTVRLSSESEDTDIGGDTIAKKVESRDGYYLITETVRDSLGGVVDRKVETKHKGALTIVSVTQVGTEFTANESGAVISSRAHTYQDFPAITKVYATGAGQISREEQSRHHFGR